MRLSPFILLNMEAILVQWEAFAVTLFPPSSNPTPLALRDHAHQILEAIAKDLDTPQSSEAQSRKSMGLNVRLIDAPETAAETHAVLRARSGFDVNQLVAEYRALRATVLRLWIDASATEQREIEDVIRFGEAIDQAIAESIAAFSAHVDQASNLLLGMLGHDMRSPLSTIRVTASYLAELNAGERVSSAASRLIRSGAAMQALLDDLMDFSRTKLGLGINIEVADADMATLFVDEIEQLRGAYPDRHLEMTAEGTTRGRWDGQRLQQLLRNLVSNAIRYGAPDAPVRIALTGTSADVQVEVRNTGPTIDRTIVDQIFNPLSRGNAVDNSDSGHDGLGLGLYIVREVAMAHGGDVSVRSEADETVFAVRLPHDSSNVSRAAP